jgi:hypothetical protein
MMMKGNVEQTTKSEKVLNQKSIGFSLNSKEKVIIDFPKEGEVVSPPHYAFSIRTNVPVIKIELSVNGGNWRPCREAAGKWWYDWNEFKSKTYAVHARSILTDGRKIISSLRRFVVNEK